MQPNSKHRRWMLAAVLVGFLLIGWMATAHWGTRQVLAGLPSSSTSQALSYDPYREDLPAPNPPWHYVHAFSPAPFLVVVDWGVMQAPLVGSGGRDYYVWLFGFKFQCGGATVWNS
ncbi:MAG: hypothetical protein KDA88_17615, partial [Planctomycetaceae bacterium]|nr:hypothetical protein [Planctomycetaceae bacterium]MCB9953876.1 hypothetical protein [Planctomycetaceae bacterium]